MPLRRSRASRATASSSRYPTDRNRARLEADGQQARQGRDSGQRIFLPKKAVRGRRVSKGRLRSGCHGGVRAQQLCYPLAARWRLRSGYGGSARSREQRHDFGRIRVGGNGTRALDEIEPFDDLVETG